MNRKMVNVPAISCHHCVMTIQRELSKLEGVRRVEADVQTKQVTVEWESPASWERIAAHLAEIDYPPA